MQLFRPFVLSARCLVYLKLTITLGLGLYALLNAVDWMMTFALLRANPDAVEANPLAAACLDRYGWDGLAVYKACGVFVFAVVVGVLARYRPPLAAGLVAFGCAVLLAVTVYAHDLIRESHHEAREMRNNPAGAKPADHDPDKFRVPERCWFAPKPPAGIAAK